MPSRDHEKRSQQPISLGSSNTNDMYIVLRDDKNDDIRIVPRSEIISAKKSGKFDVGDIVSMECEINVYEQQYCYLV